jgi:hypothetical protein
MQRIHPRQHQQSPSSSCRSTYVAVIYRPKYVFDTASSSRLRSHNHYTICTQGLMTGPILAYNPLRNETAELWQSGCPQYVIYGETSNGIPAEIDIKFQDTTYYFESDIVDASEENS